MQNLHSHSTFCDGAFSLEEMVIGAIVKGCTSFGFSGHSYAPYDTDCCMTVEGTQENISEARRLQSKYGDKIELFLGIEQDYYANPVKGEFDYIIGAVHYIKSGETFSCIDDSEESQIQECETHYGGDFYAMAERYYETMSDVAQKTNADIIAHFDLITKFNFQGSLFNESHPRYVKAALSAMDEILQTHKLFEVSSAPMYKFDKPEPYPSVTLLKELASRGGEVILSSDSHNTESICYKYDEMQEILKSCGFSHIKRLTADGFIDVRIS